VLLKCPEPGAAIHKLPHIGATLTFREVFSAIIHRGLGASRSWVHVTPSEIATSS
jgi:hypothetical protein